MLAVTTSSQAKVVNAIVNIEINKVRAWDDGFNSSSVGTGFVIDSEKGLILTNKHIMNVAPVIAYAEFSNKQSLALVPIYRDPVHDFGVFKYDPDELDNLDIIPIALTEEATVGEAIRLYGNDGGEALSIIEGVLSRIDRNAPNYNSPNTDFNTFYYQAALGSSGGSSGSPILNSNNQALAINAGARRDTAAAFFLPMRSILPTLRKVMNDETVTRGTLQTVFKFEGFNELRKVGWDDQRIAKAQARLADVQGRLIIEQIVPQSPASAVLQVGDILLSINDQALGDFYQLESTLNSSVKQSISLSVERDGKLVTTSVISDDLFPLVPARFIEYGRAVITDVGLGLARLFNIPVQGVTIVDPGPLFGSQNISPLAIIDEVNNTPISSLDDLAGVLSQVPYGDRFSLRYRYPYNNNNQEYKQVSDYSNWYANKMCRSQLGEILWACTPLRKDSNVKQPALALSKRTVTSAIVNIEVFRPLAVNLSNDVIRRGHGAVIDAKSGLILTDKSLIDSSLSQIKVSYDNGVSRSAEVLAIHPYLNMVLIKADQAKLKFAKNTVPKLTQVDIKQAENLTFISQSSFKGFTAKSNLGWPILSDGGLKFDTYAFSVQPDTFGVYVDDEQRLIAVNPAYTEKRLSNSGIPVDLILRFVQSVNNGESGLYKTEDQFNYISYGSALELGLEQTGEATIGRYISVVRAQELAQTGLQSGDVLLSLKGNELADFNQFYNQINQEFMPAEVLRNGSSMPISVKNKFIPYEELSSVLFWGGAIIHEVQRNLTTPDGFTDKCLRIGVRYFGAPIFSAKASGAFCVYSLDGVKINDLETLKTMVFDKKQGDYTTLRIIDLDKNFQLFEFRVTEDNYYWPTMYYVNDSEGWQIDTLEAKAEQ
jgi:S1-C subfamily serine protease